MRTSRSSTQTASATRRENRYRTRTSPGPPASSGTRSSTWVTEKMAKELGPGALLLRDGPLRVSHESHNPVLTRIAAHLQRPGDRPCRESASGRRQHGEAATRSSPRSSGLRRPTRSRPRGGSRSIPPSSTMPPFPQWQHGEMYVACLHPRSKGPLKIELPGIRKRRPQRQSWTGSPAAPQTAASRATRTPSSTPTARSP